VSDATPQGPEVSIYLQTYQQRAYIADALDSVLEQRTPFPTEIVVADDCSTDGTRELVRAYRDRHPDRIRLVLPDRNVGPTAMFRRGVAGLRGRYVAWLDGDDYWSDSRKLLTQVQAMDENPAWAGCFHDAVVHYVDGSAPDRRYVPGDVAGEVGLADLLRANTIPSLSVMARGDHVRALPDWVWEGLWSDWLALLGIARYGSFGYLPEAMGVYRVHQEGISAGLSRAEQLEEDLLHFELLRGSIGSEHRGAIEAATNSRRAQLAIEHAGVPFTGAVAVLSPIEDAPTYLNGRRLWGLAGAEGGSAALVARDRAGTLGRQLEQMRQAAPAAEFAVAHFPAGEGSPAEGGPGRLFLLVVGSLVEWLARYSRLGRQLEGSSRLVWAEESCALYEVLAPLHAPAPMGALIEIDDVSLAPNPQGLFGCHIDLPRSGAVTDAHAVEISGWALGAGSPVVAVELASAGQAFRRVPLGGFRADLEQAFPEHSKAGGAGFKATVSLVGTGPEVAIEVRAILKDQRRVLIGTIDGRSRWRETPAGPAPLISVIVPCYGQAPYLEEAIESVLAQTYAQVEVVVVDDGSPDNAAQLAARFPGVRCIRQANAGLAAARNTGIRESAGELLVFLDADDRLMPRALEAGLGQLTQHPEAAFAFGRYRRIGPDGGRLEDDEQPRPATDPYSVFLRYNYAGVPATGIFRRSALEEAENFDESLPGAEDYDLSLRLSRRFSVCPHEEEIVEYRVHGAGMSRDAATMLKMTREALRRQRRHVRGDREHKRAYKDGLRFWRRYYGGPMIAQVRDDLANHQWRDGFGGIILLARRNPRGLPRLLRRSRA
jgi:glycosyltransferase involved in cell wall biosynthesis